MWIIKKKKDVAKDLYNGVKIYVIEINDFDI
jgi:hypothetical protein